MKTVNELQQLKELAKKNRKCQAGSGKFRIAVGIATCGIAAGANPVYEKFEELVAQNKLEDKITVTGVGCIGECAFEPIVEVIDDLGVTTTYCKIDENKAEEIFEEHILNNQRIEKYQLYRVKR